MRCSKIQPRHLSQAQKTKKNPTSKFMAFQLSTSSAKRSIAVIAVILIIAITFETFQQLYYIKRFQIAEDVSFWELLKNHAYRWLIWLLLSSVLFWFVRKTSYNEPFASRDFVRYGLVVLGLVGLNIGIISLIQFSTVESTFSLANFSEYLQFYIFQKAPVYTLGYIAIAIILRFYFANEKLQFQVQNLSDLKLANEKLYSKLSKNLDDKTSILNIKIGNKRKIIPVEDISWIEADDYCVKVHTTKKMTYTMRSSLKALEEKLSSNFLRVHRKAIVNMDMAKEFNLSNHPNLVLANDEEIPVSKSNLKFVKKFLS